MNPRTVHRRTAHILGALLSTALAVGGCSTTGGRPASAGPSSPSSPSAPGPASATPSDPASAPASTTASPTASAPGTAPHGSVLLDEHAAGSTVRVGTGTAVLVRLHSTYWSIPASSDSQVLAAVSGGSTPTGACEPGGGCGVAAADFVARRPGSAKVTAGRRSCGEAMRCPPGQGSYTVTVEVTG
ncbi:hypothetical protein [Kitasatospora cystarginea]|uniref:hypothetical protein n=1 Tax=Kitasatospora cystarginea TaxID=58350 RepID=UPI0031E01D01